MEVISKISRGTLMDQIYLPKKRFGLEVGSYVIIKPIAKEEAQIKQKENLHFYRIKYIEPIKIEIIKQAIRIIKSVLNPKNIIFTGSILNKGFNFNDLDILIIVKEKSLLNLENEIEAKTGLKAHILQMTNNELIQGLQTDPLYQAMLSKCISEKRMIYRITNKPNYKLLDLHLLKSKVLRDNFDFLSGKEKYNLARNLVSIKLFMENKKVTNDNIDKEIIKDFSLKEINEIIDNMMNKKVFINKFNRIYQNLLNRILREIKNEPK